MTKTIAIIDDEPEMENIFELMLEDAIHKGLINLKFFSDSRTFYEWFIQNDADLILSDINMPHLSGVELSRRIRASGRSIPMYFMSGYEKSEFAPLLEGLGVSRFIQKPLNFDELQRLMESDLNLTLS